MRSASGWWRTGSSGETNPAGPACYHHGLVRLRLKWTFVWLLAAFSLCQGQKPALPARTPHTLAETVDFRLDPAAVHLLAKVAPGVHVLRAMTWDVDRDGDLDVIASTVNEPFAAWINDGYGHFTRQRPVSTPGRLDASGTIQSPLDGSL